jgi:hypothetical protein
MTLALGNRGDRVALVDPAGREIDAVGWEEGAWAPLVAPSGRVLVRRDVAVDTDSPADWDVR